MENFKCQFVADEQGNFIRTSKNPEYSYVVLEQSTTEVKNGWMKKNRVSTVILGLTKDLNTLDTSKDMVGKIIVKESLEPFNEQDPERDLKYAGQTGVVCMKGESPIYRKTEFTTNPNAQSEFIAHTNSAQIREANGQQVAVGSLDAFKEDAVEA